jgi:cell surface receptor IPT/TIG domain protein
MPAVPLGRVKVEQANYRLYQSSSTLAPGTPLAAGNTAARLPQAGASFRVRVGMENKERFMSAKQSSAGFYHSCAIVLNDKAYCWGSNNNGQLGNGSTTSSRVPVAVNMSGVLAGKTIKQISAGGDHSCVIASDDKLYCWGFNSNGELGNNSSVSSSVPVAVNTDGVLAGKVIKQMSAGFSNTCAVDSGYGIYCWGYNSNGQLGNNSTNNSRVPTYVYVPKENTTIAANAVKLRTQYAKKTAATCQAVAAGWRDVTNNSALAYSAAGPNNGTAIAAMANNPGLPPTSVGHSYQSIVRPGSDTQLTFTNNRDINSGETGLWDLALTDNGLERNTNYCVRLAADTTAAPGTSIDTYSHYPEFKTADGSLDIRFADATNATLTNPTTVFSVAMTSKTASTKTAKLSNNSSQQLEVANSLSTTGWSVSLAATGGSTAKWTQTGDAANYAFNSTNTDQGQLSVDLSSSAFTASGSMPLGQACTTAGLSYGAGGAFVAGTASANAITLATASSSSGLTCLFKLQDISLKQTIPAYQKPGTYTLPVTVTVVAQ